VIRNERNGKPLDNPKGWFERCLRKAKITGVCWHCLRHTFSTRLALAGVPLEDEIGAGAASLLDHTIPENEITKEYIHAERESRNREFVARLEKPGKPALIIPLKNTTENHMSETSGLAPAVGE
jgi:integrase